MKTVAIILHEEPNRFWLEDVLISEKETEDLGELFLKDIYEPKENTLLIGVKNIKNNKEIKQWKTTIREQFVYNKYLLPLDKESMIQEVRRGLKLKYPTTINTCVGYALDTSKEDVMKEIMENIADGLSGKEEDNNARNIGQLIRNNSLRLMTVHTQEMPYEEMKLKDLNFLKDTSKHIYLYLNDVGIQVNSAEEMADIYLEKYNNFIKSKRFDK